MGPGGDDGPADEGPGRDNGCEGDSVSIVSEDCGSR